MPTMPFTKITTKHQVTIPRNVFDELKLNIGDQVGVVAVKGSVVMTPHRLVPKYPVARLSEKEQKTLVIAKQKIKAIQDDMINSTGLTREEAAVAAKVGLIGADQQWWWLEEWQEGEREAELDIKAGRVSGPFETAEELLAHLHKQPV